MGAALPLTASRPQILRPRAVAASGSRSGWRWLAALVAATCLEGLGRKFLPFVPSLVFYFLKDAILILGLLRFGIPNQVRKTTMALMGGLAQALLFAGFLFTLLQCFNPNHASLMVAALGMKAYWLWLPAPLIIAAALRSDQDARRATQVLTSIAIMVSVLAVIQFALPGTSWLNTYALYEGKEMNDVDFVGTTGRVRVASTFSYVTGFTNFMQLIPPLVLAYAMEMRPGRKRTTVMIVVGASLATIPLSGSRGPVILAALGMGLVAWGAGFLSTRAGRRVVAGGIGGILVSLVLFPEATQGIRDRFSNTTDLSQRIADVFVAFPPVAMSTLAYPLEGEGTGMEQNAAHALRLRVSQYAAEGETARLLVELGPVGFLLIWAIRFSIALALWRASRILRRGGRGAMGGVALMLAVQSQLGRFVADHVYSALYFLCAGMVLHATVQVRAARQLQKGAWLRQNPPMRAAPRAAGSA